MFDNNGMVFLRTQEEDSVTVAFAGDFCPTNAEPAIGTGGSGKILTEIQPYLEKADLRLIQWEVPLTDTPAPIRKAGPALIAGTKNIDFFTRGKFDVALLANNHIGDQGAAGVISTLETIQAHGGFCVGAGRNREEAAKPLHLERNGLKIALLNACEFEFGEAETDTPGSHLMDIYELPAQIAEEKKHADLVLVVIHGGHECYPLPSPRMKKLYRSFVRAGASAVVNIHTHCPLGIEIYEDTPIVYSPGNFFFPSKMNSYDPRSFWWGGYLPLITFDRKGAAAIEVVPYTFTQEKIHVLTGKTREWFFHYLDDICHLLQTECEHWFDVWCTRQREAFCGMSASAPFAKLAEPDSEACKVPDVLKVLPLIRHVFTCQSHNDLMTNLMLLIERGRIDELQKDIPKLEEFMTAHFDL